MRIVANLDRKHPGDNTVCRWHIQAPKRVLLRSSSELNLKEINGVCNATPLSLF